MSTRTLFARLTGTAATDLPEDEARNGLIHVIALTLSKTADSLLDPKLVLSWLLSSLGAPGAMIGALVPVREAGALLPQLALARWVERAPRRKLVWAAASVLQGFAALGIAGAAFTLDGAAAGAAVLGFLALLALARAGASVSQKDALARTVAKGRRGAITGLAGSIAAALSFGFGLLMALGVFPLAVPTLTVAVALAGAALIVAGLCFTLLGEKARANKAGSGTGLAALVQPLADDGQLRLFIAARAALAVTALAPPFIVLLSNGEDRSALDQLGPLVMAAAAGSVLAAYVWGRLSDRSSRQTLMLAGTLAALAFTVIGGVGITLGDFGVGLTGQLAAALAMFTVQIAYEGVRAGRKLHLTDMAEDALRARYTALSNTLVGLALLVGGTAGWAADTYGAGAVLLGFAGLALIGVALASRLDEVQRDTG